MAPATTVRGPVSSRRILTRLRAPRPSQPGAGLSTERGAYPMIIGRRSSSARVASPQRIKIGWPPLANASALAVAAKRVCAGRGVLTQPTEWKE